MEESGILRGHFKPLYIKKHVCVLSPDSGVRTQKKGVRAIAQTPYQPEKRIRIDTCLSAKAK